MIEKNYFSNQFQQWINDLSRIQEFNNIKIFGNQVIVEVFREETTAQNEKVTLITEQNKSGEFITKSERIGAIIQPFGKVLAVGTEMNADYRDIKVGDILLLPDYLKSMVDNPDYILALSTTRGNEEAKVPKGMTQKIYGVDMEKWRNYRFKINKFEKLKPVDTVTFLIPCMSTMILGKLL